VLTTDQPAMLGFSESVANAINWSRLQLD